MSFPISITWQVAAPPVSSFKSMADSAKNLDAALAASGGKLEQFGSAVTRLDGPLGGAGQGMGELSSNMQGLDQSLDTSASAMGALATATGEMAGAVEGTGQSVIDLGGAIGEVGISSTDATSGVSELSSGVGELASGVESTNPPITEMNTSLSESGGIFAEAGTATGEFTGALTAMNTENQAVAGGLTENNLLMGDLTTSTGETAQSTEGLKGSMGLLSSGLTATVGSGIALFQSFTSLRDAQIRVDAATLKLDKSMTMLGTRMDKLDETTGKMNSNAGLMISGLGEWNVAMDGLNALIDQGVVSGDAWDAAMQRARVAQQGLSSSTAEGNAIIGDATVQLEKVSQGADQASINQQKLTKQTESQGFAWAQLIPNLISFIGASSGVVQIISGGKGIVTGFKDMAARLPSLTTSLFGLAGAGGALKAALIPMAAALGAIAVPVGLAVLAIGAFVAVITALRVHIKVFDDLGVAIGHVFPQSVGFLNEFRAAFISTSDAVNSSISYMLGGIDALSGGTTKSKESWDKWIASVTGAEKGSLSLNNGITVLKTGTEGLNASFVLAKEGLIIFNGNLKDANNEVIATKGNWQDMGNGTVVVTKRFQEAGVAIEGAGTATGALSGTTKSYVPIASQLTNATQEEKNAMEVAATATATFGGAMNDTVPTLFQSAQAQLESAGNADTNAAALTDVAGAANNSTPAIQATANATAGAGVAFVETTEGIYTMEQALVSQRQELNKQSDAANKTHIDNLALLDLWGVKIPKALETNKSAIAGIVAAYQKKTAAVNDELAGAYETIAANTDLSTVFDILSGTIKMTDAEVIALAKSYEEESKATLDAEAATEAFADRLKDMADEQNKAAESSRELATEVLNEGNAAKEATEARRQQAKELGVYNEMVNLAIEDQQEFLDQTQQEIDTLQDLAKARGLTNAEMITSKTTLQAYITTHERLPPTIEEATDAYTNLVVAKQDEAHETELSRQALEKYLVEQGGMPGVVGESIQVLEALDQALINVQGAYEEGRAEIISWAAEIVASQESARGNRAVLEEMASTFINFDDVIHMNSESLKMWIGILLDSKDSIEEFNGSLDEIWETMKTGVEEVDKLRMGFLEAGKGIKGSMDEDFEYVKEKFTEFNEMIASGKGLDDFKENFREGWDDIRDNTDLSVQEIDTILGTDLVAALNNPEISDLEFAHLWMTRMEEVQGRFEDTTGSLQDFAASTVSTLKAMAPEMGNALAEAFKTGNIDSFKALFASLPPDIAADLSGVTAELKAAGGDWQGALGRALATMKAGMSDAEWKSVFEPMIQNFRAAAAAGDLDAKAMVDAFDKTLKPGVQAGVTATTASISELGPAADAARLDWAKQMLEMSKILVSFGSGTQQTMVTISGAYSNMALNTGLSLVTMGRNMQAMAIIVVNFTSGVQGAAITVSGAFSNMATNTNASMNRMATSIALLGTTMLLLLRGSQQMASTVSGSFSNMANNARTSMNRIGADMTILIRAFPEMGSRANSMASQVVSAFGRVGSAASNAERQVRSLKSAIDSLRSKTIVIRTIYERVIRTIYAAQGGSFITDTPQRVGPFRVSEFGQKELISVTPLEGPSGNAIGASGLLNKETARKGRRMLDQNDRRAAATTRGGVTRVIREQPITLKVGERVLVDIVNRRLIEESDGIIV